MNNPAEGCNLDRREPSPARLSGELAIAVGLYALLAMLMLWPLPARMSDHLAYPAGTLLEADAQLIVWALAWDSHAIVTEPAKLFAANSFYPSTNSLAFSEHFLGYVPLFAPTFWLTGNPVLAANMLIFLCFLFTPAGMYLLARQHAGPGPAFVAGALYGFYPWRLASLPHMHLLGVQYLPLLLFFSDRWLRGGRSVNVVFVASALVLQSLSSVYLAAAAAFTYAAYLPLALWRWRSTLSASRLAVLGIALGLGSLPFVAASLPYVQLRQQGIIPSGGPGMSWAFYPDVIASVRWLVLVSSGIGWTGFLLAAAAFLPPWRQRRYGVLLGISLILIGLVASAGPNLMIGGWNVWTPYGLLYDFVPGISSLRTGSRFLVTSQLGLSLLAAVGLQALLEFTPSRFASPVVALAAGLAIMTLPSRTEELQLHEMPVGKNVPAPYVHLAETKGLDDPPGVLFEVPRGGPLVQARRMYLSIFHWLPIVGGYSAYPPRVSDYIYRLAFWLPGQAAMAAITGLLDIDWILVDRSQYGSDDLAERWDTPPSGLELVQESGDYLLFRVSSPAPASAAKRLLRSDFTLGGVPLRPVGASCPGSIVATAGVLAEVANSTVLRLGLVVTNESHQPWPGLAFIPRHLVQITTCFAREGERQCKAEPKPLYADIGGGESVPIKLRLTTPRFPGAYALRVDLVQGQRPLSECGFTPLEIPVTVN